VRRFFWLLALLPVLARNAGAQAEPIAQRGEVAAGSVIPPLLPEKDVAALAEELSGETAKRNLEGIARFHRQRGSQGFHSAAELVAERASAYGLSDVAILQFPADGKIFYGTQRSRPAWDAEFAELWQLAPDFTGCEEAEKNPQTASKPRPNNPAMGVCDKPTDTQPKLLASYLAQPVVLAEDSESADVTARLVDVGAGTRESDYAGQGVKGKIVLVSAPPGAVEDLAVGKFGAVGIVSYAQNQKTAWSGEDENLIRWGHLETFSPYKTFAFMVSLKTARSLRSGLGPGSQSHIRLHATVKAGQHPGNYEVVTATIPGADRQLSEEVAFSCHLDHQRPGANDNASGCVTILEVARTLEKLIRKGQLARPLRTIRFFWPPEIEGTMALLNGKPEFARRIKAVVHMDMVGGGGATKSVFHVTRGPMSLPSFVHDVAWWFAEFVNQESYNFAAGLRADYPLVAPEGGKEALLALDSPYTMGSDHDVYQDSSFGIPAIYLNDWPDRYIHTNFDTAANIDPTKLKRAAFIGAASGYFLANRKPSDALAIWPAALQGGLLREQMQALERRNVPAHEAAARNLQFCLFQTKLLQELQRDIDKLPPDALEGASFALPKCFTGAPSAAPRSGQPVAAALRFQRRSEPKGPLAVFGYDYFSDRQRGAGIAQPKLLSYRGLWGSAEEYAYETLNFVDGRRTVQEIRDSVSAEYGPVPLELVAEYLQALEKTGILERVP
jgi:aminopeptidase YwaD